MTVSASDVAAALRARVPGVGAKKLHKLLYYCQGHHLAWFGEPLFRETISAWNMGPVVGNLWHQEKHGTVPPERTQMSEAQLNTVGYVVSRYGRLSGLDLERLTHTEDPWLRADETRTPNTSAKIETASISRYFRESARAEREDDDIPLDVAAVADLVRGAGERRNPTPKRDDLHALVRRLSSRGA